MDFILDARLLRKMMKIDIPSIEQRRIEALEPFLARKDFTTEAASRVSLTLAHFARWILAVAARHRTLPRIEPLALEMSTQELHYRELIEACEEARAAVLFSMGEADALQSELAACQ
eukprot:4825907-Prymnesium_polylepis.1